LKTVLKETIIEFEEKKSKFIGYIKPVSSVNEAEKFIKSVRELHPDATHNVPLYRVMENGQEYFKYNDDGEPTNTAGKPMAEILNILDIYNVAIVATRYFGGTELGTGGLVRAYSGVTAEVLKNSTVVDVVSAKLTEFVIDYGLLPKLQHLLAELGIIIYETEYLEKVKISVLITEEVSGKFYKELIEMTAGALTESSVVREEQVNFYTEAGKVILDSRG